MEEMETDNKETHEAMEINKSEEKSGTKEGDRLEEFSEVKEVSESVDNSEKLTDLGGAKSEAVKCMDIVIKDMCEVKEEVQGEVMSDLNLLKEIENIDEKNGKKEVNLQNLETEASVEKTNRNEISVNLGVSKEQTVFQTENALETEALKKELVTEISTKKPCSKNDDCKLDSSKCLESLGHCGPSNTDSEKDKSEVKESTLEGEVKSEKESELFETENAHINEPEEKEKVVADSLNIVNEKEENMCKSEILSGDDISESNKTIKPLNEVETNKEKVIEPENCNIIKQEKHSTHSENTTVKEKISELKTSPKTAITESNKNNISQAVPKEVSIIENSNEDTMMNYKTEKRIVALPDGYTDSSHSSSLGSEAQSSAAQFESSCSSQDNTLNNGKINFENSIKTTTEWGETENAISIKTTSPSESLLPDMTSTQPKESSSTSNVVVITLEETTSLSNPASEIPPSNDSVPVPPGIGPGFPPIPLPGIPEKPGVLNNLLQPPPVPVIPTPRKRGRPRKQVLPTTGPDMILIEEKIKPVRPERRQSKKKKLDDSETAGKEGKGESNRKRSNAKPPVKRRKNTTPSGRSYKKKPPPPRKRHSEMENFQNFEEETRMSASEGPGGTWRSGVTGEDSQHSVTESHSRTINKKGRIEVSIDGCKPPTVSQIVEYFWPPPSSLPHGEKPEGLMIQEQISEYLGVKSFKRKYPSLKRRPVEMEERNYLQENGFVSENMCDLGLTAVYATDIIEIMYNDFPQKFEEYRKYTRERKAREQRALREKQAAERADMDPKKEAVESAFSWNSEFNKTRKFKVLHVSQKERFLTDGTPCPPFERVIINHAPNNSALCVENEYWKMSLFSYECEISANTKLDLRKQYASSNMWMFMVGSVQ